MHTRKTLIAAATLGLGLLAGVAIAAPVTMNFDGMGASEYVANFYDGGCSTIAGLIPATCGGPDYGVAWSGAITADTLTPTPPSSPNFMAYADGVSATMNVAAGFKDNGFSFAYYGGGPTVAVYSGVDGTGRLLSSQTLSSSLCGLSFCWTNYDFDFSGIAESVVFGGTGVFDNITFDQAASVAEPGELGIFAPGLLLLATFAVLRRRPARRPRSNPVSCFIQKIDREDV
ncbi:MAG TPA: hypothetical protein VMA54_22625 [Steroidobacteraceae bacterium]|nr:hypothetical protein [Steroidobacteraceae bacterium]